MQLFDKDGRIRHYANPGEIIREFYDVRLDYYERRRQAQIRVGVDDCGGGAVAGGWWMSEVPVPRLCACHV
jgi:hypothetical protein